MIDLGGKRIVDTATHRYNYALMGMTCTPTIATEICDLVTNGRTITSACTEKGITYSAFNYACHKNGEIADAFARAQEAGHLAVAGETIDIADRDDLEPHDKQVRINARIRVLEAFDPRFSKKIQVDVTNRIDVRQAVREADERLLRYQYQGVIGQVIDVEAEALPTPADKQSAGLAIGPPDKDIFA